MLSPFSKIVDFTFDGQGKIHFWRRTGDGSDALVTVDPHPGSVVAERPFGPIGARSYLHWTDAACIAATQFVLMKKIQPGDMSGPAYLVDFVTGEEAPLSAYRGGLARGFSRAKQGRFAAIDAQNGRITAHNPDGTERWGYDTTHDRYITNVGTAKDLAVTTDERIVVQTVDNSVKIFDWDGNHLKTVDLTGAFGNDDFGGRPGYVDQIVADANGGFFLRSFQNPPVVVRFSSDGALKSRWSPRHPDGRTFDIRPGVRVAPDGRIWTSDGDAIMRLTDDGVVDRVFGPAPDAAMLGGIAGLTVGFDGKIYAVAKRSGAIHVFNCYSRLERIDAPEPTDFPGTVKEAFIAATERGDYYVERPATQGYLPPDEYLQFSASGSRVGLVTFEPRLRTTQFGPGWAFQPGTNYRCGFTHAETLAIIDPPKTVIREIKKRPNGKWFGRVWNFAMAPDGSMAVLCGELGENQHRHEIDLFTATGEPIRTIELPDPSGHFKSLAYDGTRIVAVANDQVLVVDIDSNAVGAWGVPAPATERGEWRAYLRPRDNELWLHAGRYDYNDSTIHRYLLP